VGPLIFSSIPNPINAFANHSTLIIYAIWLKFFILKILSSKKEKKKKKKKKREALMRLQLEHYDFDLLDVDEVFQTAYILKRNL